MNIRFKHKDEIFNLNLSPITYLYGGNGSGKTTVLNYIEDGFKGKNKSFSLNGIEVDSNNYNLITFNDDSDFINEFKFTKTNDYKKAIYNKVIEKIDEELVLENVNEIFNSIDKVVNENLKLKYSNTADDIKFNINIRDLDSVINKFTDIYINELDINKDIVPKSVKRRLIYNLLELRLKENITNIVIIDNYDLYLDLEELIIIEDYLNMLTKKFDLYILLSTQNIDSSKEIYYLTTQNKILKQNFSLQQFIKETLYETTFKDKNHLLSEEDITLFIKNYPNIYNDLNKVLISKTNISNTLNLNNNVQKKLLDKIIFWYNN